MPPKPRGRPPKERSIAEFEDILMREGLKEARRVDRERRRIEAAIAAEQATRQARANDVLDLPPARPQVDTREEARLRSSVAAARMSRYGAAQQETERFAFFKTPSMLPALTSLTDQINQPTAGAAIMDATFDAAVKERVRNQKQMSLLQPKRDISARVSASEMPELTSKKPRDRGQFLGGVDRPVRDRRVLSLTTKVGETHSMYEKVKMMSLFPNIYNM
jgi:hypothetical protein